MTVFVHWRLWSFLKLQLRNWRNVRERDDTVGLALLSLTSLTHFCSFSPCSSFFLCGSTDFYLADDGNKFYWVCYDQAEWVSTVLNSFSAQKGHFSSFALRCKIPWNSRWAWPVECNDPTTQWFVPYSGVMNSVESDQATHTVFSMGTENRRWVFRLNASYFSNVLLPLVSTYDEIIMDVKLV